MKRLMLLSMTAFALLSHAPLLASSTVVKDALSDKGRPAEDKQLDADRKPAAMIAFAGIKPGSRVMDLMPGSGYFTRIFAKVVGDSGRVYAYSPVELDPMLKKMMPGLDVTTQFAAYPNVTTLHQPINALSAPELLDVVWTSQNYHDLHDPFMQPADLSVINKAIFAALKPGGVYIVLDHSAKAGSGFSATNTLHRIDEAALKQEVLAAGFKLVAESKVLRNPKDRRDKIVFDPSIRHHTDQFILKFQKPTGPALPAAVPTLPVAPTLPSIPTPPPAPTLPTVPTLPTAPTPPAVPPQTP